MENVKLFLSQKSQFHLVENMKNKNKKCTRTSLFQSSEDGEQEKFFMWPYDNERVTSEAQKENKRRENQEED